MKMCSQLFRIFNGFVLKQNSYTKRERDNSFLKSSHMIFTLHRRQKRGGRGASFQKHRSSCRADPSNGPER